MIATPAIAEGNSSVLIADDHTTGSEANTSSNTLVDVASGSDSFTTLVDALAAADLVSTLSGQGPYTVFAPTNAAFSELPDGALDFLLQPENKTILTQVLTYHVIPQEVMSSDLSTGGVSALSGGLAIGVSDSGVVVNNASVTQADISASNGVIHQINRVLIPASLQQQLATQLGVSSLYE
ncbi:MAG: fasciclin domain-containing protein [Elainellaceae cyanobacterium]